MTPLIKFFRQSRRETRYTSPYEQIALYSPVSSNWPFIDYSFEVYQIGGCGVCAFTSDTALNLDYNDQIEIWLDNERKYTGYITNIPQQGTINVYPYQCAGYSSQLRWNIIESYTISGRGLKAAVIDLLRSEIVNPDLPMLPSPTEISTSTSEINIPLEINGWDTQIENLVFEWKTPADILGILKNMAGNYEYGVGPDRKLYFRPMNPDYPADETIKYHWWEGKGIQNFTPEKSTENIKNTLIVNVGRLSNGSDFLTEYVDRNSMKKYGQRKAVIALPDSFPRFEDDNAIANICTVTTEPTGTGDTNIDDDDESTYWTSDTPQVAGCVVFNKLESADGNGVITSTIGGNGHTFGSPSFVAGKFGNGIQVDDDNYCYIEDSDIRNTKGAVSILWEAPRDRDAGGWATTQTYIWRINTEGGHISLSYYPVNKKFCVINHGKENYHWATYAAPNFSAGDWFHIGASWDSEGDSLGPALPGGVQKANLALWVTTYGTTFDPTDFKSASWSGGWVEEDITNNRITIGGDAWNEHSCEGVIDNIKVYDDIKTDFTGYQTEAAETAKQWALLEFFSQPKKVGQIRVLSGNNDNTEFYAAGIRIDVRRSGVLPDTDTDYWEIVYEQSNNSEMDLLIHIKPYPLINGIKIYQTGSGDDNWRIYEVEANEYRDGDVKQWAKNQLADYSVPEEKATLELNGITTLPEPRGKARITDRNGGEYTYPIVAVIYQSIGDTAVVTLGEMPLVVGEELRSINREMIENKYSAQKATANIASGSGLSNNSVGPSQISHVIADQMTTGKIKSRNYGDNDGMMMNLDDATMVIKATDGLVISSGGGIEIQAPNSIGGTIRGGQTAYDTGTGWWIGLDGVTPKASFGDSAGEKLLISGGNVTMTGTITATAGAIGGWTIGSTYIRDTAGVVGMSSAVTGGDDIRFWAGHATMASAPFRVTEAGVLTATSGTIGGWTLGADTLTGGATTLTASTGAIVCAHLTANTAGTIGGWTLGADTLTGGSTTLTASTGAIVCASLTANTAGQIGGFTIGATTLASGTNLVLDQSIPAIYLNNKSTYESATAGVYIGYQGALIEPTYFKGAGLDDCTSGGTFSGGSNIDYVVEIDGTGTPDTFKWSDDDGSTWDVSTVNITGAAQTLNNGVTITFAATTGHTSGDRWSFTAIKGYVANFGDNTSSLKWNGSKLNMELGKRETIIFGTDSDLIIKNGADIIFKGTYTSFFIDTVDVDPVSKFNIYPGDAVVSTVISIGQNIGETLYSDLTVIAGRQVQLYSDMDTTNKIVYWKGGVLYPDDAYDLGKTYFPWENLYLGGFIEIGGGYGSIGCTIEADGDIKTNGDIHVGTDNSEIGNIKVYGAGASNHYGGQIDLYIAADYDGTHDYWQVFPYDTTLYFQTDATANLVKFSSGGDIYAAGFVEAAGGFKDGEVAGIDWGPADPATISSMTVSGGIITAIS